MFILLYFSITYSPQHVIPMVAKLNQDEAIRIVENDFRNRQSDYDRITGIMVNNTSGYVRIEEFHQKNLKLPLVYVHPNSTLIHITDDGYKNMGRCNTGLSAYCAYLEPYNFDYEGRLVYGVEVLLGNQDNPPEAESGRGLPFLYIVDAMNGEIVDSTFIREEAYLQRQYTPPAPVLNEEEQKLASIAKNVQGLKDWSPDEWQVLTIGYLTRYDPDWRGAIVYLRLPPDASAPAYCELGWQANVMIDLETKEVVSAYYPTGPTSSCGFEFGGPIR